MAVGAIRRRRLRLGFVADVDGTALGLSVNAGGVSEFVGGIVGVASWTAGGAATSSAATAGPPDVATDASGSLAGDGGEVA